MGLKELDLQISYGPGDDRLNAFFVPALSASVMYERAAGYFSSTTLAVAATGVARLLASGGTMHMLVGADLTEDDVEAVRRGADLAERVAGRLTGRLMITPDVLVKRRLEALAWMVSTGQLEIRVVLPKGPDGHPLPASRSESYYHPKEGVFTDAEGNQLGFSGSINESATAIEENYESFCVYYSWNESRPYLAQVRRRFENLWEHKEPSWVSMPIPEAVKQELLRFRPKSAPTQDPQEPTPEPELPEPVVDEAAEADQRERVIFQFLRDAPHLLNADRLGISTCTVTAWPHQTRVVDRIVGNFPGRFMLCDEVGLGKTIEAGAAIRQLVLSGVVKRALILVPKSVLVQWQEELYEKFVLNIPRYDGHAFYDAFGRELHDGDGDNPWNAHPLLLASSHLAKRRERQLDVLAAENWDLVVIDEAHHARRKDFLNRKQFRPNRLLELLMGPLERPGLADKTRGLLLLTATPMQVDPVELFDLLKLLGMGGKWGVESNFLRYFQELGQQFESIDWWFVLSMLKDYFASGGDWDNHFCNVAEERVGAAVWDQLRQLHASSNPDSIIRQLDSAGQGVLRQMAAMHTPLRRHIFRNTRSLLREYHRLGLLKENIPQRDPRPEWIPMTVDEERLYHRIEEYISIHYQKYEAERRGLGFIMTVYRRRLTSSFYAIQRSLERRLAYLKGVAGEDWLTDEDLEQEDLDTDVSEFLPTLADESEQPVDPLDYFEDEVEYVEDFLAELRALGSDSKFEQLSQDLADLLRRRDSVIVFTQYTDTMDYLREKLRQVYGAQVACYSGRGGERWDGSGWIGTSKETIKNAFRESREVKILLCTESASEGLNLQTCGVLINYEMPWNPMRVEQRIGRIDRIGQVHDRVWIRNYFYEGTVEATVYQRLDDRIASFESIVGELQPILSRVARVIEAAAMARDEQRGALLAKEIAEINAHVRSHEISTLDLDRYAAERATSPDDRPSPVTLPELERAIVGSRAFGDRLQPHPELAGAHMLDWHGAWEPVTFSPELFDEHPSTLRLLTYGDEMFDNMLEVVAEPRYSANDGHAARCSAAPRLPLVGYWKTSGAKPLHRLSDLLVTLAAADSGSDSSASMISLNFEASVNEFLRRESMAAAYRRNAIESSLVEDVRHLLLEAVYVDLARASQPGLFEDDVPVVFSTQAYDNLMRHRIPFVGARKITGADVLLPRHDDPTFASLQGLRRDVLNRKFDAIRTKLGERLRELMALRSGGAAVSVDDDEHRVAPIRVALLGALHPQSDSTGP